MLVHEAGEVRVKTFVPGDEFVAEGEPWHEASLLQPEDGREGATEEDAFYRSEGNDPLCVGGGVVRDPSEGPVCFLLNAWQSLDGVEEAMLLFGRADVGVNEEAVHFAVDVFNRDLEAIEAASFCDLDLKRRLTV